ncbi:MAG: HNH endonuclease signature motif containing protein [Phenylobacterium sp.]
MTSRRPPLALADRVRGTCRWCGEPILHEAGARVGEVNGRRFWHPACVEAYKLSAWRREQVRFVRKRDGARCAACAAAPKKWKPGRTGKDKETGARYQRVRRSCALELDHRTPLWSIAHLPETERRAYYAPGNLQLLCPPCHKAKTVREAGERAAARRPHVPAEADIRSGFDAYLQAFRRITAPAGSPPPRG